MAIMTSRATTRPCGRHAVALPSFLEKMTPSQSSGPTAETGGRLFENEPPSLLFFDLETTGLSGGAGTYTFLVGFGSFDEEGFRTRQFFLRGYGEERALLHAGDAGYVAGRRDACLTGPVLVTYNGRGFDVPFNRDALPVQPDAVAVRRARARGHAVPGPAPLEAAFTAGTGVPPVGSLSPAGGGIFPPPGRRSHAAGRKPVR